MSILGVTAIGKTRLDWLLELWDRGRAICAAGGNYRTFGDPAIDAAVINAWGDWRDLGTSRLFEPAAIVETRAADRSLPVVTDAMVRTAIRKAYASSFAGKCHAGLVELAWGNVLAWTRQLNGLPAEHARLSDMAESFLAGQWN